MNQKPFEETKYVIRDAKDNYLFQGTKKQCVEYFGGVEKLEYTKELLDDLKNEYGVWEGGEFTCKYCHEVIDSEENSHLSDCITNLFVSSIKFHPHPPAEKEEEHKPLELSDVVMKMDRKLTELENKLRKLNAKFVTIIDLDNAVRRLERKMNVVMNFQTYLHKHTANTIGVIGISGEIIQPSLDDGNGNSDTALVSNTTSNDGKKKPKVICFCGSSKFVSEMAILMWEFEKLGNICMGLHLLPDAYFQGKDYIADENNLIHHLAEQDGVHVEMDELHKRKIDLADEIFVVNVKGYIGDSTRSEIEYATKHGKPVKYLEPQNENDGKILITKKDCEKKRKVRLACGGIRELTSFNANDFPDYPIFSHAMNWSVNGLYMPGNGNFNIIAFAPDDGKVAKWRWVEMSGHKTPIFSITDEHFANNDDFHSCPISEDTHKLVVKIPETLRRMRPEEH